MKNRNRTQRIARIGIFVALTTVGAWISVPIGQVPVTLQLFFALLSGYVLGAADGFVAMLVYLLLGALGLPVFANFTGGFAVLFSSVGGYLISFPLAAFFAGKTYTLKNKSLRIVLSVALPIFIIYLFGSVQLSLFLKSFKKAIIVGVLPFVAIDITKAVIALSVAHKINNSIINK